MWVSYVIKSAQFWLKIKEFSQIFLDNPMESDYKWF